MNECTTVSIIIVDFHKADQVVTNVYQLQKQIYSPGYNIFIEDNSCDSVNAEKLYELEKYNNVQISINTANKGYIRACNDAAEKSRTDYIILVNPDIYWIDNTTISELVSLMNNNPEIGIAGPRQINKDNTTPDTVRAFPNILALVARRTPLKKLPLLRKHVDKYEMPDFDYSKSQYVDWIQSSLLIIRRELWDRVGGLDSAYFLFMSDPDICFKAWKHGYKVYYTADSIVGADGIRCSAGGAIDIFKNRALQYHLKDALIYQLKYLFKSNPRKC